MEATEEDRGQKRSRCTSGDHNLSLNSDSALVNRSDSLASQTTTKSQNLDFVQDALSNFTVLRNIFKLLDERDLESCSNVSQYWRTVADPFILSHYDIKLDTSDVRRVDAQASRYNIVQVKEMDRYNHKNFTQYDSDFADVTQRLEKVLLTQKISISLEISIDVEIEEDEVMNFISKFGFLVLDFSFNFIKMNVVDFCKLIVGNFPNLKKLHCSRLRLNISKCPVEEQYFNPESSQIKHEKLRKISFGRDCEINEPSMETMLKTFANLEEIENFPAELINQIVVAGKHEALKSFSHFGSQSDVFGESCVTVYEKLALLQPKLTALRLKPEGISRENINPYLFSVLQGSHESLKSLVIPPIAAEEVRHFPTLEELKTLELDQRKQRGAFFPPEISLTEKFPNVTTLCLWEASVGVGFINLNFPESKIIPWGSQINHLNIGPMIAGHLPSLRGIFPSVQGLGIRCPATEIPSLLKQIPDFWPKLKLLSFRIGHESHKERWRKWRLLRLDHAFTGIPEYVIDQLEDPSRKNDFTEKQIQGFKDQSLISKLKDLKELEVVLEDCEYRAGVSSTGTFIQLSRVAHEFGFSLLPELKVTVKIESYSRYSKAIMLDFDPFEPCDNVESDSSDDDD